MINEGEKKEENYFLSLKHTNLPLSSYYKYMFVFIEEIYLLITLLDWKENIVYNIISQKEKKMSL